jgi:hypothetical protein
MCYEFVVSGEEWSGVEWSGVEWCVIRVVVRKVKVNYQHEREAKYACMQLRPQETPNDGLSYP